MQSQWEQPLTEQRLNTEDMLPCMLPPVLVFLADYSLVVNRSLRSITPRKHFITGTSMYSWVQSSS